MVNGSIITSLGKQVILNRAFKAVPDYTVQSQFSIGISNGTPNVADTALDVRIPILDGTTNDDGSNTGNLVGTNGAANSTDNTTTYKEGGGNSDDTAQNLVTNGAGVNATKTWTIANLVALGTKMSDTEAFGFWLYIDDAADLAKFLAAGTCLEVRFRTNGDAANLSYLKTWTLADLAVGWNWLTSGTTVLNGLTQGAGGPPSNLALIDEVIIEVTTANATDEFNVAVAGELVFDLLRQWATTDLVKNYVSGYPTIDETNFEVEMRGKLTTLNANGFPIDGYGDYNTDATNKIVTEDTFTDESKSSTDQFTFISKVRLI